jgi:AbiU2
LLDWANFYRWPFVRFGRHSTWALVILWLAAPERHPAWDLPTNTRASIISHPDYIKAMGPDLAEFLLVLMGEHVWLSTKLDDWHELFVADQHTTKLLGEMASDFFAQIDQIYIESIVLHVCRMTDKEKGGHGYVSIHGLADLINEPAIKTRCQRLVSTAHKSAESCRVWRNHRIAHNARSVRLSSGGKTLKGFSYNDLAICRDALFDVLKCVHGAYLPHELAPKIVRRGSGATGIVNRLLASKKFSDLQVARLDPTFDFRLWSGWDC